MQVTGGNGFVLYQVTLKNAPKFRVSIQSTLGFKVWGITIDTPATSPNADGGTYGGVADVSVCDLSLDGTTNGLRIKSDSSRGGAVERVSSGRSGVSGHDLAGLRGVGRGRIGVSRSALSTCSLNTCSQVLCRRKS